MQLLFIYVFSLAIISRGMSYTLWPWYGSTGSAPAKDIVLNETSFDHINNEIGSLTRKINFAPIETVKKAKLYARYAGAAYCKDARLVGNWTCALHCNRNETQGTVIKGVFENRQYKTRAYIAVNEDVKRIIIAFRGSNQWRNFLSDLKVSKLDYTLPGKASTIKVHRGFIHCTDSLKPQVLGMIKDLISKPDYRDYEVVVTGHSLGGAIAVLTALYLKDEANVPISKLHVYTYGQPRIGNDKFAEYVNNSKIPILRITNRNDPVPHMPPALLGFRHHNKELYLPNPTTTISCSMNLKSLKDDPKCSASRSLILNPNQHLKAWNIMLGSNC